MNGDWLVVNGVVVRGHGVASGVSAESPYPHGSIPMQKPFFRALGLDLSDCHDGTLNVSIAPLTFALHAPRHTFTDVAWTDIVPPETFSFSPCRVRFGRITVDGCIYYPHPETKQHHFQAPSTLEILAPLVPGITTGSAVQLYLRPDEVTIHTP